jgi:hypothetical protein
MAQFMVIITENEAGDRNRDPSETKVLVEGHSAYNRKLRAVSAFVDSERLRPSSEGWRVSNRDGESRIDQGPFADKALSGYYVLEAEKLADAVKLTEECPMSPGAELEVRPLMKGNIQPDKTGKPGRVFAFAVLGNAPNERGWIDVMDRFDESSREGFPADRFLGGVRLLEPGRGQRVSLSTGGRRAILDGPFLESKEVIGGLFFMRMATPEEAIEWASRSDFVKHGTVEIRELWRS